MAKSRTIGFGTGVGEEGVVVSPEIIKELENPLQAIAEYLRDIRDRYCLPAGMMPLPFQLAANRTRKFDFSQAEYNSVLLTVVSGVAQLYFGDFSGFDTQVGPTPPVVVDATLAQQTLQIALPPGPIIFTVQASSVGTAVGCLTPMAL